MADKKEQLTIEQIYLLASHGYSPAGSEGSAAGGGRSDRSEWQRSADAKVL